MTDATLTALALFPLQLQAHYAAIPDGHAHWTPTSWDGIPSERFAPIAQLCHVRDIEREGYHVRFRRALQEAHPQLVDIDSYALAEWRDYAACHDPRAVLDDFAAARADTVALLSKLTPRELARTAHFPGYGQVTVRGLMHYLCSHDQQHLSGLQWLLGRIEAARQAPA
jgi:hypothetical protein